MSSTTKIYEEKMNNCVAHLDRELTSIRAGRANPGILDKVMVDYYGSPTPVQQVASVAVSEARILTITPWDGTLIKAISKAIQTSDIGINPIDDGHTIRLVFPAPTEERRKQLTKDVQKQGEEAKIAVRNVRRDAMDKFTPRLLDLGLACMIGKGKRDEAVKAAVVRNGAVYLAAIGGAGALMAGSVKSCEIIAWPDLGCEAVRRLEVVDMPLTVLLDAHGGDLYQSGPQAYLQSLT